MVNDAEPKSTKTQVLGPLPLNRGTTGATPAKFHPQETRFLIDSRSTLNPTLTKPDNPKN